MALSPPRARIPMTSGSERGRVWRYAVLVVLGLVSTSLLWTSTAAPASAATPRRVGFGIVPSTATDLDVRALYSFGLTPGAVAQDHVAVVNYSNRPLPLNVYAADAINASSGGYALRPADDHPTGVGSWVTIGGTHGVRTIKVPGRRSDGTPGRVILPVAITVPANATPGDHAGGLIASLDTIGKNPKGENIKLQQRVASRVYIQVGGTLQPDLAVTMISATYHAGSFPWQAGSVTVAYTLTNGGNIRMGFRPSVQVAGPFGLGRHEATARKIAELLPGNGVTLHTTVPGVRGLGVLDVTVVAEPTAAIAAAVPSIKPARQSLRIWFFSWTLVLLLLLLLAAGTYVVIRWRRRRPAGGAGALRSRHATPRRAPATVGR